MCGLLRAKGFPWISPAGHILVLVPRSDREFVPTFQQSRTQSPQAFWSAGRRQERLWDNGISYPNLVPRVFRLFGQRGGARRDSGIMEKYNFFDWSSA